MKRFSDIYRNSKLHYFISSFLERFEMEGFTISYSQSGEDLVLKAIFGKNKRSGFFVDVGCNNPIQKNNTFKLYLKGWSGINIDGNEGQIKKYKSLRKRDISLNEVISNENKEIIFFQDDYNPALSCVDPSIANDLKAQQHNIKEIRKTAKTLEGILDQYGNNRPIDLLCVDVEEHDLEVLQGNNFQKYRPQIICIECFDDIKTIPGNEVNTFLIKNGYELIAVSSPNIFYNDKFNPIKIIKNSSPAPGQLH